MEIINGEVLTVEEVKTKNQTAIIKKHFDQVYHIKLTTDKTTILANGVDTATITARIYNYLNEPQDFEGIEITFELNGEIIVETTIQGEASIPFISEEPGSFIFTARTPGYRSGEIEVTANV